MPLRRHLVPFVFGWGVLQLVTGLAWAVGVAGYPVPAAIEGIAASSVLAAVSPVAGGLALAATGAVAVAAAIRTRGGRAGVGRIWLVGVALTAAVLTLLVPDASLLAALGYTPVLLVGAPFGWPEGAGLADPWSWTAIHQAWSVAGGLGIAALVARARRPTGDARRLDPGRYDRIARLAVAVAVVVPSIYAATRFAWALGVPLGISEEVLAMGAEDGMWLLGAGLGTVGLVGAGLTVGLVRPWGETVPRWVPRFGGRAVPPAVATVPATVVAVLVTSSGLMFWRLLVAGAFEDFFAGSGWSVLGPELLWPAWGAALGTAAWAYHHRRRSSQTEVTV